MNIGTLPLPRWPLSAGDIDRACSEPGLDEGLEEGLSVGLEGLEGLKRLSGIGKGDSVEGSLVGKKVWLFRCGAMPWVHG